jgi:hypothetical protein
MALSETDQKFLNLAIEQAKKGAYTKKKPHLLFDREGLKYIHKFSRWQ